jgi:hypothetical protein
MANQQIKRLWRRRPEVDEAEFELLQSRVLARLMGPDSSADSPPVSEGQPAGEETEVAASPDANAATASAGVTRYELPDVVVGVMAEAGDPVWDVPSILAAQAEAELAAINEPEAIAEPDLAPEPEAIAEPDLAAESEAVAELGAVPALDPTPQVIEPAESSAQPAVAIPATESTAAAIASRRPRSKATEETGGHASSVTNATNTNEVAIESPAPLADLAPPAVRKAPKSRSTDRRPSPALPLLSSTASRSRVPAAAPYCPYCALLLDPVPESSRRCPRCRERIMVKRVDGRAIYLTAAAVLVFEAERKRMTNAGRWTRERARWLKIAAAVDAPSERLAKLERAPLSEEVVAASKALYTNTVDRSFRTAKRERRWVDATRIKREQALVLFRLGGSSIPPPDDAVDAHRDAASASLHGIAEMSREAELVSRRCCDACDADDGHIFKIASELRTPRLPHSGCPRGLCRCDWFLAVRDQSMVRLNLRRRARAEVSASDRGA